MGAQALHPSIGTMQWPRSALSMGGPAGGRRKQAKRNKSTRAANPYEPQLPAGFTAFPSGAEPSGRAPMAAGPSPAYYASTPVQQPGLGQPVVQGMQPHYSGAAMTHFINLACRALRVMWLSDCRGC